MIVSLTATAASTALILANGEYVFSLFVWGGGSLEQQSWGPGISLGFRVLIGGGIAFFLLRPLTLLALDNANARSLGLSLAASRLLVIAIAVWLAASITAEVGILGFVGLVAPTLAQLSGARRLKAKLIVAPAIGAVLLWLTDGCVSLLQTVTGDRLPVGAATALLGGPLLLWMLPRLRMFEWPSGKSEESAVRLKRAGLFFAVLLLLVLLAAAITLTLGRGQDGFVLARGELFDALLDWRLQRLALAGLSGGMLALAGAILQRMTGNPLASPEILGVGLGAGGGLAVVLLLPVAGLSMQWLGATIGSVLALIFILAVAARSGFGAEKLLLAGVGLGAMVSSILTAIIATGSPQAFVLLGWLSGTGAQATPMQLWLAAIALAAGFALLLTLSRWLDILPLGSVTMRGLGLSLILPRLVIVLIAALLTAIASMMVGPLSFVGLIAPHLARNFGLHTPKRFLTASMLIGALMMVSADWLARMVAFPYNLPLGLFASLLGGACFVALLSRRSSL
jgi:iron complex transport system permease protein